MKKYTYTDHSNWPHDRIVFECVAQDILEADELYKQKVKVFGKPSNPVKQPFIGCSIEPLN